MSLKKGSYYSREDFVKHVCTIVVGRYLYDGSTEVSFLEIAEYLNISTDTLRMRKKDKKVMTMLEEQGIKVKKIKGINYFLTEEFHLVIDNRDEAADNDLII